MICERDNWSPPVTGSCIVLAWISVGTIEAVLWKQKVAWPDGEHTKQDTFGPSGVHALPLAAGINVGGHYKWHFFLFLSFSLSSLSPAHC